MKKLRMIWGILVFALLLSLASQAVAAQQNSAVTSGCHSVDALRSLMPGDKLLETSKAVLVYERGSDTLVYGYNTDQKIYPSSMVKLMTALVALERGSLSDVVTVRRSALSHVAIGSVSAGLKAGEELTLESLLYCLMAASANDAAVVIADHISGSQEDFIRLMNDKALALGCTGTHYSNVHGLHDEDTYTTIRDVCKILDAALENETFRTLFQAKEHTVPATNKCEERIVKSTNDMMLKGRYFDERITGGKTGATDAAGRCLAVTAEQNGMELIAIVMGAVPTYEVEGIELKTHGSYEEMAVLLDHVFQNYEYRQIFYADEALQQYPVSGGTNHVVLSPVSSMSAVLPVNVDKSQLSWVYGTAVGEIQAPVTAGQVISTLQVWYGDLCLAQTDLAAMNAVDIWKEPVDGSRPVQEEDNGAKTVLIIVGICLGLVILFFAGRAVGRSIRRAVIRKRRLRRRREQRRRGNA